VLDHVAGLLHEARRQIEIQFGQRNSDQQTMNAQLTAFVRPSVLRIPPSTPIARRWKPWSSPRSAR
jgi:hypothetical protein